MSNASAKYHTESERKIGMVLWQHALSQDLGEVTVLQICQEAGVSRATFYRHFSGPKQALCDVIEDYQSDLPCGGKHTESMGRRGDRQGGSAEISAAAA